MSNQCHYHSSYAQSNLSLSNPSYSHSSYAYSSLTCPCQITVILTAHMPSLNWPGPIIIILTAHIHGLTCPGPNKTILTSPIPGPNCPGTIPAFTTSFSHLLFMVQPALEQSLPSLPHSHSLYSRSNLPWNNLCLHYLILTAYIHGLTCPGWFNQNHLTAPGLMEPSSHLRCLPLAIFTCCVASTRTLYKDNCSTSKQCCGSVIFWNGYGSVDPYLWLTDPDPSLDPDPAIFVTDLQDGN